MFKLKLKAKDEIEMLYRFFTDYETALTKSVEEQTQSETSLKEKTEFIGYMKPLIEFAEPYREEGGEPRLTYNYEWCFEEWKERMAKNLFLKYADTILELRFRLHYRLELAKKLGWEDERKEVLRVTDFLSDLIYEADEIMKKWREE